MPIAKKNSLNQPLGPCHGPRRSRRTEGGEKQPSTAEEGNAQGRSKKEEQPSGEEHPGARPEGRGRPDAGLGCAAGPHPDGRGRPAEAHQRRRREDHHGKQKKAEGRGEAHKRRRREASRPASLSEEAWARSGPAKKKKSGLSGSGWEGLGGRSIQ